VLFVGVSSMKKKTFKISKTEVLTNLNKMFNIHSCRSEKHYNEEKGCEETVVSICLLNAISKVKMWKPQDAEKNTNKGIAEFFAKTAKDWKLNERKIKGNKFLLTLKLKKDDGQIEVLNEKSRTTAELCAVLAEKMYKNNFVFK